MPTPITIALSISAGVSISAGLSALFVALRRQQPILQLTFAVMCLLIALTHVAQLLTFHSADLGAHTALFKTQITLEILIGTVMLHFATRYTGISGSRFLPLWTIFGLVLVIANSLLPAGLLFSEIRQINGFTFPWGEQIFLPTTTASPLGLVFALFPLGVFAYTIYGCVQQYLAGQQRGALILGVVAFIVGITAAHDLIVDMLGIKTLTVFEFGLLTLVAAMSIQFADEIIIAERDLRVMHDELESIVENRTTELRDANVLLAKEVNVRTQTEESLQGRLRDLNTLNDISRTITSVHDLPRALEAITQTVKMLFAANRCMVHASDSQVGQVSSLQEFLHQHAVRAVLVNAIDTRPEEVPAFNAAANRGESILIEDATSDPRTQHGNAPALIGEVRTLMVTPLKARGEIIGTIAVSRDKSGAAFTESELALFENIAADVASALENARLNQQAQQAAVDVERQRLARDLHDSVTQSLYSLTLLANGWGTMAQNNKLTDIPGSFRQLVEVGQQALKEMRLLIHQLRPPILEEAGLTGALRQRLEAVERRVDIKTRLHADGDVDALPLDTQEQLFQIAQEALNNSLRHAEASQVLIEISLEKNVVVMAIEDDGMGYDPDNTLAGMGTVSMRERARQIGGSVLVRSALNAGTTVEVTVHLSPQPAL